MSARTRALLAAVAVALTCAGCGLGAGPGTSGVTLTVTRGFGRQQLALLHKARVPGSETVMRMLERSFPVTTRYGGGFVQSIDGVSGRPGSADWFYYVNGVQAPQGAASTSIHAGDRIWWDYHDYRATQSVPAVVGSFPEPFLNGIAGKRFPVTIECTGDVTRACQRVTDELAAEHIPSAPQLIGTGSGPDTLGLVVGTWPEIRSQVASELVAHGPGASGVYARFAGANGNSLQLLNADGKVARTLGPGSGLVAATADQTSVPTWLVTGTDPTGVEAAARQLTPAALHDHFAVAVSGNSTIPVPVQGSP